MRNHDAATGEERDIAPRVSGKWLDSRTLDPKKTLRRWHITATPDRNLLTNRQCEPKPRQVRGQCQKLSSISSFAALDRPSNAISQHDSHPGFRVLVRMSRGSRPSEVPLGQCQHRSNCPWSCLAGMQQRAVCSWPGDFQHEDVAI